MAAIRGGGFAAVGLDGIKVTSEDGRDWQNVHESGDGMTYKFACFGGGRCLALGKTGPKEIVAVSDDGRNWDLGATGESTYGGGVCGLTYFNDEFILFTGSGTSANNTNPAIKTSPDGLTWSDKTSISGNFRLHGFASDGSILVGVGEKGRRSYSSDGKNWVNDDDVRPLDTMISVAYGNRIFVGSGLHGMRMTTDDGKSWSSRIDGEEGEHINSMLWTGSEFVGIGLGATYLSRDGSSWTRKPNENPPTSAAYGNGIFVGIRWKGRVMISRDAIVWENVYRAASHLEAISFGEFGP